MPKKERLETFPRNICSACAVTVCCHSFCHFIRSFLRTYILTSCVFFFHALFLHVFNKSWSWSWLVDTIELQSKHRVKTFIKRGSNRRPWKFVNIWTWNWMAIHTTTINLLLKANALRFPNIVWKTSNCSLILLILNQDSECGSRPQIESLQNVNVWCSQSFSNCTLT